MVKGWKADALEYRDNKLIDLYEDGSYELVHICERLGIVGSYHTQLKMAYKRTGRKRKRKSEGHKDANS